MWLGVWLDCQLQLNEHHSTRLKEAETAHRANGPVSGELQEGHDGLHSVGCHVRSRAVVEGRNTRGTVGRANELRLWSLVSRTSHLYHSNLPIHTSSLTLYKT